MSGYVYLLQPRELVGTERIKVGCSGNDRCLKRLKSYKNGTRYLIFFSTPNVKEVEKMIKDAFNNKFELIAGLEYFKCNITQAKKLFLEVISNIVEEETEETKELYNQIETTNSLIHFLKSKQVNIGKNRCCPEEVFIEMFNRYCEDMNLGKTIWTRKYCLAPFSQFDIEIRDNVRIRYPDIANQQPFCDNFIIGVDVLLGNNIITKFL